MLFNLYTQTGLKKHHRDEVKRNKISKFEKNAKLNFKDHVTKYTHTCAFNFKRVALKIVGRRFIRVFKFTHTGPKIECC